ncbi:MAG: hypothetical protein ACRDPM_02635 [Solirubrobacteraceae bacterium]
MRRGRKPQTPEVDPEFAELVAGLYYAFEDNLERCTRLTRLYHDGATAGELHEEALAGARRIAYVERVVFEAMAHVIDVRSLPPTILPFGVHSALARLAYALIALAEDDPEPEALLSQDAIHGLARHYQIEEWVTRHREHNPNPKAANR